MLGKEIGGRQSTTEAFIVLEVLNNWSKHKQNTQTHRHADLDPPKRRASYHTPTMFIHLKKNGHKFLSNKLHTVS